VNAPETENETEMGIIGESAAQVAIDHRRRVENPAAVATIIETSHQYIRAPTGAPIEGK